MKKETKKEKNKVIDSRKKISPEFRAVLDVYHKETDKKIKAQALDFQRYTGALSENFQHGLSAVAEQYSGLVEKVDDIKKTLDSHTEMIGVIMKDVSVLKEDVAVLKEDVSVLKKDVAEIKEDLKTKADKTEVIHLSRRVSALEHTS